MTDSPAYRLNHEEVIKALEEGIWFAENLDPREIVADEHDHVRALRMEGPSGPVELPARTVLVAAGTSPNVIYEKERPQTFQLDAKKRFFQGFRAEKVDGTLSLVPDPGGFFTSYNDKGRLISYYGDNHPTYAGNVVKAMASAKDGYRHVVALFDDRRRASRSGGAVQARCGLVAAGAAARQRPAGDRGTGGAADADHRRGGGEGAGRGAALQPRPVLSAAELRGAGHARQGAGRAAAPDGRPGAHRRVGGPGARACCR